MPVEFSAPVIGIGFRSCCFLELLVLVPETSVGHGFQ